MADQRTEVFSRLIGQLQQLDLAPERARRAAAAAEAINAMVAAAAWRELAFEDNPADYATLLLRGTGLVQERE